MVVTGFSWLTQDVCAQIVAACSAWCPCTCIWTCTRLYMHVYTGELLKCQSCVTTSLFMVCEFVQTFARKNRNIEMTDLYHAVWVYTKCNLLRFHQNYLLHQMVKGCIWDEQKGIRVTRHACDMCVGNTCCSMLGMPLVQEGAWKKPGPT